ncbi:MAG: hypothetical protein AAF399_26775, partial [Bacteroidota bacterium]
PARIPVLIGVILLLAVSGRGLNSTFAAPPTPPAFVHDSSGEFHLLDNGIYECRTMDHLVYLKPPVSTWKSDHSPAICWQASGYEMKQIQQTVIAGQAVYQAIFTRGAERLYTAWWYDNGDHQTHLQLDWRRRQLQGETPYCLINVTTAEKKLAFSPLRRPATTQIGTSLVMRWVGNVSIVGNMRRGRVDDI